MALDGIIVLHKPAGMSSNRAMGVVKRLLGASKMGYLGTLDPLATGVLPLFTGKATKLIAAFEGSDKTYRVTLKLGERTDTHDAEGAVIERRPLDGLDEAAVRSAILAFAGTSEQQTPAFSAVKVDGVPAYRLARQGKAVPARPRTVRFSEIAVEAVEPPHATFSVRCSAGAYMRSLAEDIGAALGVGAHVAALERTCVHALFTLENSITLEDMKIRVARGDTTMVRNPAEFMPDFHPMTVDDEAMRKLRHGQPVPLVVEALPAPPPRVKMLRPDGTLVAVGAAARAPAGQWIVRPVKVLV